MFTSERHLLSLDEFKGITPLNVDFSHSVHVKIDVLAEKIDFFSIYHNGRVDACCTYVEQLMTQCCEQLRSDRGRYSFIFNGSDIPDDSECVGWQRKKNYQKLCLTPDFYYTAALGYSNFSAQPVIPWIQRRSVAFWRGSTTGLVNIDTLLLTELPRYRLCQIGAELGENADFGICSVVQTRSEVDQTAVMEHLVEQLFYKNYVQLPEFQLYKYIVQVDGNANSWGLVAKLALGCCMLKVESEWEVWHDRYLRPWIHYVPVRSDLADLPLKLEWYIRNDDEAREIGERARRFVLSIDYRLEMADVLSTICRCSSALTHL